MKNIKHLLVLFFLLFCFASIAQSQSITLKMKRPPLNQLSVSDLYNIELVNTTNERVEFYLFGTLAESKAGLIATATTVPITLGPKERKQFKASDLPQTPDISYPNTDNRYKEALMRKGSLPDGNYTICLYAKQTETNEELGNDCIDQEITIESEAEITLLTPDNKIQIGADEPVIFSWAVLGGKSEGPYKIKIVEIKGDESPDNAILKNKAFFEKEDIRMTTFQYPSSAPKFKEGKTYAWQISTGKIKSSIFSLNLISLISDEYNFIRQDLRSIKTPETEIEKIIEKFKRENSGVKLPFILSTGPDRTAGQPCTNGGFEMNDFSSWNTGISGSNSGGLPIGFGLNLNSTGNVAATYTGGFNAETFWGRHIILPDGQWETSTGLDPILAQLTTPYSLPVVAPGGSTRSLRLGNPKTGLGAESISQTFLASSQNFSFSYALVLQESHSGAGGAINGSESFLLVRILDMSGNEIYRLEEVGAPSNPFVSFGTLPSSTFIFQNQNYGIGQRIFYRDWSCVNITLPPDVVGQNVTVEFITADCSGGAHWGYAYIDNVCTGCSGSGNNNGSNGINSISGNCVPLQICGTYQPPVLNGVSGTLQSINLQFYQNGVPVSGYGPFTPVINASNNTYCFNISPSDFPTPPNPDGFDVVTTINFGLNGGTVPVSSGSLSGFVAGQNNDFFVNCSNPCDSLSVTAQSVPGGDCCWSINLINNQSAIGINGVQFLTEAPITFSGYPATPSNTQWQYQSSSPLNLSLVNISGNNLPQGQTNNFINFCLNNYVTTPQSVIVNWKHNDSTVCTDTLKLNCQRDCMQLNIDSVYCFGSGYNVNFSFLNQAGFDIHTLELTPVTPGIIITPALITLSPDVITGNTSGMQTVFVSNADDLSELCFVVKAIGPENCCFCIDTICVPVQSCICSDVDASASYVGPGCLWNVALNNNYLPNYFTGVSLDILTSGVTYSGTVTAPTGWMLNNPSPFTTVTYKPLPWTNSGKIPGGTTTPLSFSLAGYTSSPTTIVVNWLTAGQNGDSIVCRDTLTLNCTPLPSNNGCLGIFNDSLWCNADGTFGYNFQVFNAVTGFTADGFALSSLPVGSATFTPAVFPGLNLPSLTSSNVLNTTISDINSGEQLCFRTTMYDSIYSINNQTWSTLCCHFDTCYTMPNCSNVVNDSCKCGQWLEPWDDISEQIKLTVSNAAGSATYYVDCDYNLSTPVGPLPAGNTVTLQASYQCNPYTCAAVYDWYLVNTTTSQTIASGTDVSMPINFTPPANVAATYHFVLIPNCGTNNCDTCGFYFTTTTGPTNCNCALGSWNTTNNLISYTTGSTPMNVSMSNGAMYTVNTNSNVTLSPSYNCPPNCGPVSYSYRLNNDPVVTGPWTITNITSVQDMMIFAKCGDKFCDSMRISIRPSQQQGCNCGVNNPFTGQITISNPTTNRQLMCGTNSGVTFSGGNYTVQAPAFICQGTPQCPAQYYATVIRNGTNIVNNQLLPGSVFSLNLIAPTSFTQTAAYTIKFNVYCNGVLCDSCKVSFLVGNSIIISPGGGFDRIRDIIFKPRPNVFPTIFNPVSTLTPSFSFDKVSTGILRLMEITTGFENKVDPLKTLDRDPVFEIPVSNTGKVEFPTSEVKTDLTKGSKYIWILYNVDEKNSDMNILDAGVFIAGDDTNRYEVITGKCEDCGKCDLCFEYNGECYCITKKK
jgi:hypothetical protein